MSTGKKAIVVVFAVALNIILMVSCAVADTRSYVWTYEYGTENTQVRFLLGIPF